MSVRFIRLLLPLLAVIFFQGTARAGGDPQSCDRRLVVKMWETHDYVPTSNKTFSQNLQAAATQKLQDQANAVNFTLLVSCPLYENTPIGADLLNQKFQWGSFVASGGSTLKHWNLRVIDKPYDANNDNSGSICEKYIEAELSTVHGVRIGNTMSDTIVKSLDQAAEDYNNRVRFQIPVSCKYSDGLNVGDDLMTHFRWGSYVINNSVGIFRLKVVEKTDRAQ